MTTTLAPTRSRRSPRSSARDLAMLTGPGARSILAAGVGTAGGTIVRWRPRQVQLTGRGAMATYFTKVRWADGQVRDETLAACTGDLPEHALVLDDGVVRVAVWRFPHDPDLPGLAAATDEASVATLLAELGLGSGVERLDVRAYRPRRRAVIEAVGPNGRLFIKVVRPDRVEELHQRHRLLVAAGVPAPHSLGWDSNGLLVLQALPGQTLRDKLRTHQTGLPAAEDILELLDRLPAGLTAVAAKPSWLDRVGHYASAIGTTLPDQAERAADIAAAIIAEAGTGPTVPIHGDLYESQLLVHNSRICGLLDIDTARSGDRLDDLGCLIGHLSVLAHLEPNNAKGINAFGTSNLVAFERTVDPADLRYRAAAVVISLATGPHRVQQPHWPATTRRLVGLADQWLASARRKRG